MDDRNLDHLLADVHRLLGELDDPEFLAKDDSAMTAEDIEIDYDQFYEEMPPEPEPAPAPVSDETMVFRPADRQTSWTQTQRLPRHVAKLQQNQEQAYADWLFEQGQRHNDAPPPPEPGRKARRRPQPEPDMPMPPQKKRHGVRNFIVVLLVLAFLLLTATVFLLPRQPRAAGLENRRDGVSTILLAGTDQGGSRTDTLMLFTVDVPGKTMSLVSIPRDTLVTGPYAVPKLNSVYGVNGGGAEGMDMVMERVGELIGFRPDGYILIELDAFVELVDALGGVKFDVPQDMSYQDPAQGLNIDLKAGVQRLSGQQAMGLVRFRSGYADADLGRIKVQRDFLTAVLDQASGIKGILKSPQLLQTLRENALTDLTAAQTMWIARAALTIGAKNLSTVTLPGTPKNFSTGSYYVLDPALVAQTVNTYCSPYTDEITTEDLTIRQG